MEDILNALKRPLIRISGILVIILAGILAGTPVLAQIYEPEGLNMPGAWNSWVNPPTNNLALASSTQVSNGRVVKISSGTIRWQTIFSVAATGGDLTGGTYEWLFTSGPVTNYYQNKWANVTVAMNTLQLYTIGAATNNSITLANGKWYTMNYEDLGYVDTHAIFMETSAEPATITSVSVPSNVSTGTPAAIDVVLGGLPCIEEYFFIRYSVDAWATSAAVPVILAGSSGSAQIPAQPAGTVVSYYAFSTTMASVTSDYDLVTIRLNNNGGVNYSYTVGAAPPAITFANLQWPETGQIIPPADFDVYGQAYIEGQTGVPGPAPGLQAWVGFHSANTNPSTWTNWVTAVYNGPAGNNDEFKANIGNALVLPGTYYYATRYQLNADPYVYGGFSPTGGGFWDGVTNVSGVVDVMVGLPEEIDGMTVTYPNPTAGRLVIELPVPAVVRLTNLTGCVILQKEFLSGRQIIDISGFRNGAYLLQVITGDRMTHQMVIKQ